MSDYQVGDTIYHKFTTRAFASGVPTVLAGTPVVSIYEDDSVTQITAGITLSVDFDSVVGLNHLTVVATGANGFETGKFYQAVITTGTVGGVSVVGETVWTFSLESSAAALDLANGTDGLGAIKSDTATTLVDTNELQVDWANGGRLDLILDARMAEASINTTGGAVDTVTTLTNKTGFSLAATGLDAIASTATGMVEAAKAVWDRVISKANHNISQSAGKEVRGLGSSVIRTDTAQGPGTGNNQIQLDASASAVDGSYDPSLVSIISGTGVGQSRLVLQYNGTTKTATVDRDWKVNPDATSEYTLVADSGGNHVNEGLAQAGASNTITLNTLASAVDDAYIGQIVFLRSGTGQDQAGTVIDYNGTTKVATIDKTWGTTPDTTTGYVMIPASPVILANTTHTGAIIPTVSTLTGHTAQTGDSYARLGAPAGADVSADIAAVKVDTAATLVDTNELQTDWANGGRLDLILDARAAEATVAALNDITSANVNTEVADVLFTDTHAELASIPAANAPLADKINYIFMNIRNKMTQTATTATLYADDTTTAVGTSTVSDDATTATKGEWS